jgi:membrane-associated phospholipid phosphatase
MSGLRALELRLLRRITCDWETDVVDAVAAFANDTAFGVAVFALLFLLAASTARGRARLPRAAVATLVGMGLAHAGLRASWLLFDVDRPGDLFSEEETLRGPIERAACGEHPEMWVERSHPPKSPAFPSSHAVTSGAAAAGVSCASVAAGAGGWIYAVLVGLGRLYWGKHWPTDVLGGFAFSIVATWIGWRVAPRLLAVAAAVTARRRTHATRVEPDRSG